MFLKVIQRIVYLTFALSFSTRVSADEGEASRPCYLFSEGSAWNCSYSIRGDLSQPRLDETIPSLSVPEKTALFDVNINGKTNITDHLRFTLDSDLIARRSWDFKKRNTLTGAVELSQSGTSENPAYRLALNESYFLYEWSPEFQFTFGKKRILWGSGLANNPTDVLNPGKNFLDPTLERRGAWLLQAERVLEDNAFALLVAPGVEEDKNTLPQKVYSYRSSSNSGATNHLLTGFRWYRLWGNADLNFMIFHSDQYKEDLRSNWKYGASWSQSLVRLSKQLEGHAEFLVQKGSQRLDPNLQSRTAEDNWYVNFLIGSRYDFDNESALVVEFFRQADGDSRSDLKNRLERIVGLSRSLRQVSNQSTVASGFSPAFNIPGLFNGTAGSQSETSRAVSNLFQKNYLFVNWQRYKFNDDLYLSWSVVHNLHDASGFQGPILQWSPIQSTTITFSASSDYALLPNTGVAVEGLGRVRENELNPVQSRLGLEIKTFF